MHDQMQFCKGDKKCIVEEKDCRKRVEEPEKRMIWDQNGKGWRCKNEIFENHFTFESVREVVITIQEHLSRLPADLLILARGRPVTIRAKSLQLI